MTTIRLRSLIDALPAPVPADTIIRAQRWAGHEPVVLLDGDAVTFPENVAVPLTGSIDVPATDGRYCIRWTLNSPARGIRPLIRYTSIPTGGPVDFADLVDVDPATFEPSDDVAAAWEAAVDDVSRIYDETRQISVQVLSDAENAAEAATSAANAAERAAASAEAVTGAVNANDAIMTSIARDDDSAFHRELSATFAPLHELQVVAVGGSGEGSMEWWQPGGGWQAAPLLSDTPGWSNADHTYTIPETGNYLCVGTMRLLDGTPGANTALTVWRSFGDGPHVAWYGSGTSMRQSLIYTTVERFTAGERIFLETYIDAAVPVAFASGRLAIARIG